MIFVVVLRVPLGRGVRFDEHEGGGVAAARVWGLR